MSDLRAEAKILLEQMPEDKLLGTIKVLKYLLNTTDLFWKNENQGQPSDSTAGFEPSNYTQAYWDRKFKKNMRTNNILLKILWVEIAVVIVFDIVIIVGGVDMVASIFK